VILGKARFKADHQRPVRTTDVYGEEDFVWSSQGTMWCDLRQANASRSTEALQDVGVYAVVMFFPWGPSVSVEREDRMVVEGRTYNVLSVVDRRHDIGAIEVTASEAEA
jgi:head-tail adaptor